MSSGDTKIGPETGHESAALEANIERLEDLTQRLVSVLAHKRHVPASLQGPGQDLYVKAVSAYWAEMMHNPAKIFEHQVEFWGKTVKHYIEAQQALMGGEFMAPDDHMPTDRRFASDLWRSNPWFNYVKQQYQLNAQAVRQAVEDVEDLDAAEKKRLRYFSQQIIDLFAPTNFLATNPDALALAAETEGQSLVDGLENLVRDLEANDGELIVNLADKDAFTVGENIASTPGKVVFRNRMLELIQYEPTTEKVHQTPLILFPPWINKFYILDLKPQNSLIKWIVDQGYTLFVVSWKNPDPSYADTTMSDYIEEGYMAAIEQVKTICNVRKLNAIGYCIAGTTLSLTLSLMKQRGDDSVKSATFFTTLTDFSDQGEVGVFLSEDFVGGIEEEVKRVGILDKFYMTRTFSYLRSNDLVYGPAIQSYMMGKAPPAFDLLYWNGDGTNLPAAMAVEYLRGLCQADSFAQGGFPVAGGVAKIEDVDLPICSIACVSDHIAAWKSAYRGFRKMGSKDKTFILSGSGHIAGIVNPPAKKKYGHWLNPDMPESPEDWQSGAENHEGSWWPVWEEWLRPRSGRLIKARAPGGPEHPPLCDAPGSYVSEVPEKST